MLVSIENKTQLLKSSILVYKVKDKPNFGEKYIIKDIIFDEDSNNCSYLLESKENDSVILEYSDFLLLQSDFALDTFLFYGKELKDVALMSEILINLLSVKYPENSTEENKLSLYKNVSLSLWKLLNYSLTEILTDQKVTFQYVNKIWSKAIINMKKKLKFEAFLDVSANTFRVYSCAMFLQMGNEKELDNFQKITGWNCKNAISENVSEDIDKIIFSAVAAKNIKDNSKKDKEVC